MTALDAAIDQAKELFAALGAVSHRKMFGGAGLYAEGAMFALIAYEEIYLKVDDALTEALAAEGSAPFVYEGKGESTTMSYWRLPEAALDDADAAVAWARRSLEVALAAKAAKPTRPRRPRARKR